MAIAMTPATEAIMGALPKEKAGVGSAMNDVLRELGGTLGVAVLGSILASKYAGGMEGSTDGLPPEAADGQRRQRRRGAHGGRGDRGLGERPGLLR